MRGWVARVTRMTRMAIKGVPCGVVGKHANTRIHECKSRIFLQESSQRTYFICFLSPNSLVPLGSYTRDRMAK